MDHTKMNSKVLDFPCRELSIRGLGFVVALPVRPGIDFFCVSLLKEQFSCRLARRALLRVGWPEPGTG